MASCRRQASIVVMPSPTLLCTELLSTHFMLGNGQNSIWLRSEMILAAGWLHQRMLTEGCLAEKAELVMLKGVSFQHHAASSILPARRPLLISDTACCKHKMKRHAAAELFRDN